MSEVKVNAKTDATKINNEVAVLSTREDTVSDNPWIIGVSKTHPGLKYYFNTVTGVSLWNISREDVERAKQTMKANGNQPQYINCPEPKDPPPSKKPPANLLGVQTYCEHISQQNKSYNKQLLNSGLNRDTTGFTCDVCYASIKTTPNVITVNFQQCPHPTCVSSLGNPCTTLPQNQIQSSTVILDTSSYESNHCNTTINHLLGSRRSLNRCVAEMMVQGTNNEHVHNQSNRDSDFLNHHTHHFGMLDLTALKMFAKNGVVKDKWYIIADANVYLHHINFLKSVVNSDNQCNLMVPQNVKTELENATKTEIRTKAHSACYYIYKMFDYGFAFIVEDNADKIEEKSNKEHMLDCCTKLKEQNFYVVVISNDLELIKYRNKICTPVFTVEELKEYLCKSNHSVTTKSPEPTFNTPQNSKRTKMSTPHNPSMSNYNLPDISHSIISMPDSRVKRNQNIQSSLTFIDNGVQGHEAYDECKITADVKGQTNVPIVQLDLTGNVKKESCLPGQNLDLKKRNEIKISDNKSDEPLIHSNIQGRSKRIKLRRKKNFSQSEQNESTKLTSVSKTHMNISNLTARSSSNKKILLDKKLEEQNKNLSNTTEEFKSDKITTTDSTKQKEHLNQSLRLHQGIILQSESQKENMANKNVMFEVTSEVMSQNLRTRCDEWVSRFVQIMEEALTQVLRKNSPLYLPPPWNMYEAITCIEKRFKDDEDIADATKKFLNVLNRISDEKGNVNVNVNPTQYMEIYSFGVYVIDTLQGKFSTCEDLQTAAESLSKLLGDIQDPEAYNSNLEQFNCISQNEHFINDSESPDDNVELLMIVETESISREGLPGDTQYISNLLETVTSENDMPKNNIARSQHGSKPGTLNNTKWSNSIIPKDDYTSKYYQFKGANVNCNNKPQEDSNVVCTDTATASDATSVISPSRYNLRTRHMSKSLDKHELSLSQGNESSINVLCKSTFLSNFMLQKNTVKENHPTNQLTPEENFDQNITNDNISENLQISDSSQKANTNSNEQKIVRNFVICSEYEDRLRTRNVEMDELNFEDELMETDYIDEGESSGDSARLEIDDFPEYHVNNDVDGHMEPEIARNTEYIKVDLKYFIRRIAQEIKELSSEVYAFSHDSCQALNSSVASDDKSDVHKRAEQVRLGIDKLCTALSNILYREKNGGCNLQALINTEFNNISVDVEQMETYGAFIVRCLEQARDLNKIIKDVLSVVCQL